MDIFTLVLWLVTGIALIISIRKSKDKTMKSVKKAGGMMKNMFGKIIGILLLIGIILTFMPPETIKDTLGRSDSIYSIFISALVGSITLIPGFVAFPLVGSLMDAGASIVPVVAFLTTLMMVGVVTYPLEKQEFGRRFALLRNAICFVFAILIAVIMGGII